jgi:uncharacterized membrane protein
VTEAGEFAGRFHPLLVHFPIALLVLAAVSEGIRAARRRAPDPESSLPPTSRETQLIALGAVGALVSAGAGYLLGTTGGYAGDTFDRHLTLGFAVAGLAIVTAAASWYRDRAPGRARSRVARALLATTVLTLAWAAHLGATLTHGDGYLTEYAPARLRALLSGLPGRARAAGATVPPDQARIYPTVVAPILKEHCSGCHGTAKVQGGLRLDAPEFIRKGGDDGPVIVPGRAASSEIIRRIWLPAGHDDAMPPKSARPLAPADAALLRWWVDSGASFDGTLADLDIPGDVLPALEAVLGPITRGGPTVPSVSLSAPDPKALIALRDGGLLVEPVADGSPFLQVRLTPRGDGKDDERVASLRPVSRHVLWLDLSGAGITDAAFDTIAQLPHVTRLNLSRTAITDAALAKLAPLAHLEYLNLYGTGVTDAGLATLAPLGRLRRLHVWQTAVTPDGVQRLRAANPRVEAFLGTPEVLGSAPAGEQFR